MFTLGNKLNRSYSLYFPFMDDFCTISVVFNKSNSFVGINLDQDHYIRYKKGQLRSSVYTDLHESAFASTFLDIRDFRSKNLDIRRQFNNILKPFKDTIHYETNETIKLSKISSHGKELESCLFIYAFRVTDFSNDFLYCLVERQHIDVVLDKKIVRTSAIQVSSNDCFEDLSAKIESENRKIIKKSDYQNPNQAIDDVFKEKKSVRKLI